MRSSDFYSYWGKAEPSQDDGNDCHLLVYHSLDVAAVAACWWDLNPALKRAFVSSSDAEEAELRAWVLFFITLHDLGKFDFRFQRKSPETAYRLWSGFRDSADDKSYDHGKGGYSWFVKEWSGYGFGMQNIDSAFRWAGAVMGHHGRLLAGTPTIDMSAGYADEHVLSHDRSARKSWISAMDKMFLGPAGLAVNNNTTIPRVPSLLAGFCSVCDWLGSNKDYFSYVSCVEEGSIEYYMEMRLDAAVRALRDSGLVSKPLSHGGFGSLFTEYEPQGVQTLVDEWPLEPGLTIIEAPTGSGKTEAALAYASRLLSAGLADGIIFALPTQATANAMLERMEKVAARLFPRESNVVLAHGKAKYNPSFINLKKASEARTAQGDEDALVQCSRWLSTSRKRVFLGQIGVCTIDQVLLSVLPVRHNFVRSFGLQKNVLIVDEIHAYDTYMCGLLDKVLQCQRDAGASAVLLSATLPAHQRKKLLDAWGHADDRFYSMEYPLVSHVGDVGRFWSLPDEAGPPERKISVTLISTPTVLPDDTLLAKIVDAAEKGAKVAVVCNLVADAQLLYSTLHNMTSKPVRLFHSRYRFVDRQRIEEDVLKCYGKGAYSIEGSILVATQVVEQSLDIDFDWMITQICPVDLLFQRIGRLHRHERTRPVGFVDPHVCVITTSSREYDYGRLKYIYDNSRFLWRTQHLLERNTTITLPSDYREWIEVVYDEDDWPDEPEVVIRDAMKYWGEERARLFEAQRIVESAANPLDDTDANVAVLTRDGETNLNVLPLSTMDGRLCLLDGTSFDSIAECELEEFINMNVVSVPRYWKKYLPMHDSSGIYRLHMEHRDGRWVSTGTPVLFTYSKTEGLRKEDTR